MKESIIIASEVKGLCFGLKFPRKLFPSSNARPKNLKTILDMRYIQIQTDVKKVDKIGIPINALPYWSGGPKTNI